MKHISLFILIGIALGLNACAPAKTARVTEISVEAKEFSFQPANIEVIVGAQIRLVVRNVGTVEHDWSIQEIDATVFNAGSQPAPHDMPGMSKPPALHAAAQVGQTARLEFRPEKVGTYEIFCTTPGHKEAGMIGRLIVIVKEE